MLSALLDAGRSPGELGLCAVKSSMLPSSSSLFDDHLVANSSKPSPHLDLLSEVVQLELVAVDGIEGGTRVWAKRMREVDCGADF